VSTDFQNRYKPVPGRSQSKWPLRLCNYETQNFSVRAHNDVFRSFAERVPLAKGNRTMIENTAESCCEPGKLYIQKFNRKCNCNSRPMGVLRARRSSRPSDRVRTTSVNVTLSRAGSQSCCCSSLTLVRHQGGNFLLPFSTREIERLHTEQVGRPALRAAALYPR
jgi:hypothetical protein